MEHFDVLIVGAGLSGIGAAWHLSHECNALTFAIIEARETSGGTWDLFRYPGVRSDSDMFTLGYVFKPWTDAKAIADGPSILAYIRETAEESGLDAKVRYGKRVIGAAWSTALARWTVTLADVATGTTSEMTCGFLWGNTGYYRYDQGHRPTFVGEEDFSGTIVHPQHWPDDLEWNDKRVVVIGSGATAVTLVPELAKDASHVTLLQRSPTYVVAAPAVDKVADLLRRYLPSRLAYSIVRWKNVLFSMATFQASRRKPAFMKGLIRKGAVAALPAEYPVDVHFNPSYDPWDQRICLVPDGDLFKAIGRGSADVVTETISHLDRDGIVLSSGEHLAADLIVTATGLELQLLGGMNLTVDGEAVDLASKVAYRGIMLCGVPNLAMTFGYTNASWTLKADLTSAYLCRLLNKMRAEHKAVVTPTPPPPSIPLEPFMNLSSGYITRAADTLPKQAASKPWRLHQNYALDVATFRYAALDDGLVFS